MNKSKDKKDINKKDKKTKEPKKNLNTKITISKLVSIFIIFLILLIIISFIRTKIINYKLYLEIIKSNIELSNSTNLYAETYRYGNINKLSSSTKTWSKGNHVKKESTHTNSLDDKLYTSIMYKDIEKKLEIYPEPKVICKETYMCNVSTALDPIIILTSIDCSTPLDYFKNFLYTSNITVESIFNTPCYKITYTSEGTYETAWFDATTLYPVLTLSPIGYTTYNFQECDLSEEELIIDTTGYEIWDYTTEKPFKVN